MLYLLEWQIIIIPNSLHVWFYNLCSHCNYLNEQVQQNGSQTEVQVAHKCKTYVRYDSDYTFSAIRGVHVYIYCGCGLMDHLPLRCHGGKGRH